MQGIKNTNRRLSVDFNCEKIFGKKNVLYDNISPSQTHFLYSILYFYNIFTFLQ